ncbi:MAG TPA: phosphatase PAP2 family protein [Cyclobacteriaceae bacterium]|nr:phosphatase PAP2 family protein [Cyclobacteriaceae bacterium]
MDATRNYHRFIIFLYWYTLIGLLALSLLFSKSDVVLWVNRNHSDFLDSFCKTITRLGEGWIFIPVLVYTLFIRYSLSLAIVSMMSAHGIICAAAKRIFFANALRPTAIINNELLYLVPGVAYHSNYSFPSGHTATIFCFVVFVSFLIRHRLASFFLLIIALLVGYSRIYLLQHFLLDVTAGAFIGTLTAFFIAYLFDRNDFPNWTKSRLTVGVANRKLSLQTK